MQTNMLIQYSQCHNINDLLTVCNIIDTYFPKYSLNYRNINMLYTSNMFKLSHEDFNKYCEFQFGVLDIFNEKMNFTKSCDIEKHSAECFSQAITKYQSRLQGYLMERIGTIFFINYFKDKSINFRDIVYTSDKILV